MKIIFKGKYKSITTFESDALSDFTVITGKNGNGKSQLIYCIQPSAIVNRQSPPVTFQLIIEPNLTKIQVSDLLYKSNGAANNSIVRTKIDSYYNLFNSLKPKHKEFHNILIEKEINLRDFLKLDKSQINTLLDIDDFKGYAIPLLSESGFLGQHGMNEESVLTTFKNSLRNDVIQSEIFFKVKEYTNKSLNDFEQEDFFKTPLSEKYIDSSDMFNSKAETIFINYLKRRHDNDYLNYRNERFGETNNVIADFEFEKLYPAPWHIINGILKENKIPLRVKEYNVKDYSESISVDIKFKKEGINDLISFDDLSSGEKVIIGLIMILFTEKYYGQDLNFPELIVLDEPDATLHPEMSKLLIDVLYKSFVVRLGIKVIMTTHSPSTIALTPDGCIYEMSNLPICSLKKISKDSALELLTGVLPTLSIDYKNHRQIFLESPTDVFYFQMLFNKLNSEEPQNGKLYFISNEMGKSNCDWVKAIVSKLREGNVKKAYGIIDWDGKNSSTKEVIVHGENTRYSIENFIYDPIYLCILFLEKLNGAHNIKDELNFDETYNQYNLIFESEQRLQEIWDWFINKFTIRYANLKSQTVTKNVIYYNKSQVKVPDWYLVMQGHQLETKLREVFSSLSKFTSEGELQNNLSIIMAKCFPLVPIESIDVIKELCA